VSFTLQGPLDGIHRFLGIELLQKIRRLIFLTSKIFLEVIGDADFQFHLQNIPATARQVNHGLIIFFLLSLF
jgi:hypothetical protein